jgi:hypothetical protein
VFVSLDSFYLHLTHLLLITEDLFNVIIWLWNNSINRIFPHLLHRDVGWELSFDAETVTPWELFILSKHQHLLFQLHLCWVLI